MTKYILGSGGTSSYPDKAKKINNEIVKGLSEKPKLLMCFFAQKREDWEIKYKEYCAGFLSNVDGGIKPEFELAMPNSFEKQVDWSDAVLLQGGDDHLLQYWLKKFDIPNIFEEKVVAGSSAGSNVLVESFWTCDWRECMDGLGILPIKFIAHFNSNEYAKDDPRGSIDWQKSLDELKNYGDKNLPIHKPEEGGYVVFER